MVQRFVCVSFWLTLLFCFVMAVIPTPIELPASDKSQHLVAFATLTTLALLSYRHVRPLMIFTYLAAFGALIEVVQGFIGRDADLVDWAADLLAILVATAVVRVVQNVATVTIR